MATEKRLIDANSLLATMKEMYCDGCKNYEGVRCRACDFDSCMYDIDDAPTVDAVEVVHGQWVSDKADILFHCSVCETQISTDWDYDDLYWNYCPNCGAKMDGDGNA